MAIRLRTNPMAGGDRCYAPAPSFNLPHPPPSTCLFLVQPHPRELDEQKHVP
ncbi:hypothetical protein BDD12DRAFT_831116 [Trichophaea hybrida]|nr:hypothetical protein BDD12DRAFT_831116 [Trichophaea hybrida]